MKKDILFTVSSYFRDDMNIMAYRFGKGEKTCAVVGALRGDEVQQLYVCARLVSFLREVEKAGGIQPGKSVMVVPTAIGASGNRKIWISTAVSPAIPPARRPSESPVRCSSGSSTIVTAYS